MFGTIRKHQQWLWVVIITAVIISFVLYFSPNQGPGNGNLGSQQIGTIDGQAVDDQQVRSALSQAKLSGFLRYGEAFQSGRAEQMGFNLKQETMQRLFLGIRLKEAGIQVSDDAVATWIREYLKDPKTGVVNFDAFLKNALQPSGFSESEFFEFVRYEVGLQELERVVGITGQLVTPQEAEATFRRDNETLTVSLVAFSSSNYVASVAMNDAKLGEFFTNRLANYRIPERVTLSFVRFPAGNFTATAETEIAARPNFTNELEQVYTQRGPDAFRDPSGAPMAKDAALAKIREVTIQQRSVQLAAQQANEFANELYQIEPATPANLAALAAKKGLAVEQTPPFADSERAQGLDDINPNSIAQALSKVTPSQPFLTPLAGQQGVVVSAVTGRTPSSVPSLDAVRGQVENDYKTSASTEAARNAGRAFQASATNSIAAGKSFADAAQAASLTPVDFSFSPSSPSIPGLDGRINPAQVKTAAGRLSPGGVGEFVPTFDGGFILTLRERKAPAEDLVKSGVGSFLGELRQQREREAFNTWFLTEYQKSGATQLAERIGF
ncbi:MAG: SurA N-terminal domain-containing protein [Limisphaerales bacterium]